jgi:thiol-disulfide isomerase/thioredoxin
VFRAKRRAVVVAAAVLAGVLITVVFVTGWTDSGGGGNSGVSYVGGNTSAVLYAPGHRPLAPEFTGTTLTGSRLRFSSYRGKAVVVNFWGSWCPPCRSEAPILADLAARYRSAGVSFLGVDVRDTTASAQAFARSFGITYPSMSDPGSAIPLEFSARVPIAATPTTVVIDRTGHIAGLVIGAVTYQTMTTMLHDVAASS